MSTWLHSVSMNLGHLRGFASMSGEGKDLSPRVRQLRAEDLMPPTDPNELPEGLEDPDAMKGVIFRKSFTSKGSRGGLNWYTCCGSKFVFPLVTLLLSLFFSIGLALYIWEYRKPIMSEGAFGKLSQNNRPESVQEANFAKARVRAVSGPTLLGLGIEGNGTIVGAAEGFEWRRVEIIYQVLTGSVVSQKVLTAANKFENSLRDLPGWKILCNDRVPKAQQRFCQPGDSFPAVMFATEQEVTDDLKTEGVLVENVFDGLSTTAFLSLGGILELLTKFHPEVFKRWYKVDVARTDVHKAKVMRTMFAFYLQSKETDLYEQFVIDELEDKLKSGAKDGLVAPAIDGAEPEELATIFYRADGVSIEEFRYAVDNALLWAGVAAFGAFISTLVCTRRLLLAFASLMLAGIASATSSAAVSKYHEDGFVEFPVVAIASWFLNAVNSADLAIACVTAWEIEDAFPRTSFGEFARMVSHRLSMCGTPNPKAKIKSCFWHLLQGLIWMIDKSFPARDSDSPALTPLTEWFPLGRNYWFLVHLLMPPVVSGGVFMIIASQTELLLLQEFAMHAGPGLLMSAFFAAVLYPPVIDLGDVLNDYTQHIRFFKSINTALQNHCLPLECGAIPEWRGLLRGPLEVFAVMLNGKPIRIIALLLSVAVIIGFAYSEFTSAFVATPPPLFPAGHRSREGPKVREIFGQMPRNLEAPENTLTSARKCTPEAFDNATCSWYKCEVDQKIMPEYGRCLCKHRWGASALTTEPPTTTTLVQTTSTVSPSSGSTTLPASITPTGSCSAVARIAGVADYNAFPQGTFWKWAESALGMTLGDGNNQVLEPQQIGSIEMEDWRTGKMKVSSQFSIGLKLAAQDMPQIEDACVSLMCYCDVSPCDLGVDWQSTGQVKYTDRTQTTTEPDRRLQQQAKSFLERRILPLSGAHLFYDYRRLAGGSDATVDMNMQSIHIIWGLTKTDEIPFRTTNSELKFDKGFKMEDPWTQRSISGLCDGVAPDLLIVASQCWILDFKRWVTGNGELFPVASDLFYSRFFQWTVYRYSYLEAASNVEGGGAGGGWGYDYFWLAESGILTGTFATFKVAAPAAKLRKETKEFMTRWSAYIDKRNKIADAVDRNSAAWIASPLFAQSQTTEIVRASTYLAVGSMLGVACFMTMVLTCSLGITVAILTTLILALFTFGTFWTGVGNRDIGSMEIVSLSVFLSGLATSLIRVATAYAYARDRPHLPLDMMLQEAETAGGPVVKGDITAEELQEISKQHAYDMGEGEILMFPGAINNERQNRVATAMQRGGASALGLGGAAVIGGLALLPLEMEALGQVGLSILCMGFAVPPAIGLLSLLLLLGFGDSKARRKACNELGGYMWSRLSGKIHHEGMGLLDGRSKDDKVKAGLHRRFTKAADDPDLEHALSTTVVRLEPQVQPQLPQHKPHTVAAIMLGAPVSFATGNAEMPWKRMKKKKAQDQKDTKDSTDDVGSEAGPCILTLDVQGATAKPPYHIVMATRDVINVKG